MTIKTITRKASQSIMRIDELNTRKKQALVRGVYGVLLTGIAIFLMALDPVQVITDWFVRMEEGSFIFGMWQEPPYELYLDVYIFNYTNVPEFLSGKHNKLKIEEVGPFVYAEKRRNFNMTVDRSRGVLSMIPDTNLTFLPERSIARTEDVRIIVPNLALIVLSTLATDTQPWFTNKFAGTLIKGLGSQLFLDLNAEEYLWGYRDPLVSIASTIAPGWIDFGDIGILDRFYDQKPVEVEVELSKEKGNRYSIISYDGSPGLREQGFRSVNTSKPCNLIKGTYEGLMLNPNLSRDTKVRLFRKQACRVYPFDFEHEGLMDNGVPYYRYALEESAFNSSSRFACDCQGPCLPDGFVDISNCFYKFPVSLSRPHYLDADPRESARYEGLKPDRQKHATYMDYEPTLAIPVKLRMTIQANIAVRTSEYNTITAAVDKHHLPLVWLTMYCDSIPDNVSMLLQLRVLYGPPAMVAFEVILFLLGCWLLVTCLHRYFAPLKKLKNIPLDTKVLKSLDENDKTEAEALL